MGRLTGAALGWLRRHLGGRGPAPASPDGELLELGAALGLLESLICDGVVHRARLPRTAGEARRAEFGGEVARNAFGAPVIEQEGASADGALALATGMALTGLRTTAWLTGDELAEARGSLRDAAERLVPMVVHVADAGGASVHAACHALSDSPLLVALPHDPQHALDLSLVARRVSERALVPGLVVSPAGALARLSLPDAARVRAWLGASDDLIEAPTEAQRILFGAQRRAMTRWFDPDHPVATATVRGPEEAARARRSREVFFWDHVEALVRDALAELAAQTGRPLGLVAPYRLDDADVVLVATGADVQTARAAADHLRERRRRVGVLGLPWLQPFPTAEVAAALGRRKRAAVIVAERVEGPAASHPPLLGLVEGTADVEPGRLISAIGDELAADRLVAVCDAASSGPLPAQVRLEAVDAGDTGLPRHDALLQRVRGAYPSLAAGHAPDSPTGAPGLTPNGLAVALAAHLAEAPPDAFERLADALTTDATPFVRGTAREPEPGAWLARVQTAATHFADPGVDAPVDALVLLLDDPGDLGHPLQAVRSGGVILLAAADVRPDVWRLLPPGWRAVVRERELAVFLVDGGLDEALQALETWRDGTTDALTALDWRALEPERPTEAPVAPVLRHIEGSRAAFDSLPRFWGEVAEPRREGVVDRTPHPLAATGAVPALASALEPDPVGAPQLPALDPAACTACGRCWSACPDSALGASVVGVEALLDAGADLARTHGVAAAAVRRNHKHLAKRLSKALMKGGDEALNRGHLDEAWTWLAERLDLDDEARAAHDAAFAATADVVEDLAPVVTDVFFRDAELATSGSGELFVLAMDPRACQGCAICVHSCPEDALSAGPRTRADADAARQRWSRWEALPDTSGKTLAKAMADPGIGRMAGALLSRHVALAQAGGGVSEPGSGERLAMRLVAACAEEQGQRSLTGAVEAIDARLAALDRQVRGALSGAVEGVALEVIGEALEGLSAGQHDLSDLSLQLAEAGRAPTFEREPLLRMSRAADRLGEARRRLTTGADGLGRARFGVIVTRGPLSEWAGRYPRHPYHAPMTVEPTDRGVELARGIAQGMMADHVALTRALRRAEVVADQPPDVRERLEAIERLQWDDLTADERRACPPLLLVGDRSSLGDAGLGWLTRLLASRLPVKVVMLDGRDDLEPRPEPALVAMAHRTAFVLSTSVGAPDHLAAGMRDALTFDGPAFVHVHAPSPRRLGTPSERTPEVARGAIHARAHVLLRYDPRLEGPFGRRASLEGNPALERDHGDVDFVAWARQLERFAGHFDAEGEPSERLRAAAAHREGIWQTLRELTGDVSSFTEALRGELAAELAADHNRQIAQLTAERDQAVAAAEQGSQARVAARLTERLMTLAGYGPRGDA